RIEIEVGFKAHSPGEYRVQAVGSGENGIRGGEPFRVTAVAAGPISATPSLAAPILTHPWQQPVCKHAARLTGAADDDRGNPALSATSRHTVYTVLSQPQAPWDSAAEANMPWTDALDIACHWASGVRDPEGAASAITQKVFGVGAQNADPRF